LTKRQEELFHELEEIDQTEVPPERKSFFDRIREFFSPAPNPQRPQGARRHDEAEGTEQLP
jgi:hypothetical protein